MGRGLSAATKKRNTNIKMTYGCEEIDNNCYVYRMVDGVKTLVDVRPGMPSLVGNAASRAWNQAYVSKTGGA